MKRITDDASKNACVCAGVNASVVDQPNTRGLLTFAGDVTLTFSRISLLNIKMSNGFDMSHTTSSAVWFETTGNVSITDWSNDGTVAPDLSGLGAIGFDSTGSTEQTIWMHDINVKCAPLCFSMFGDAASVIFENSNFVSDIPVDIRESKAFPTSTGVWVNSTGNLQVTNCQFKGFGTDYGALSVFATNVTVTNCSFDNNVALTSGAGLSIRCCHASLLMMCSQKNHCMLTYAYNMMLAMHWCRSLHHRNWKLEGTWPFCK